MVKGKETDLYTFSEKRKVLSLLLPSYEGKERDMRANRTYGIQKKILRIIDGSVHSYRFDIRCYRNFYSYNHHQEGTRWVLQIQINKSI